MVRSQPSHDAGAATEVAPGEGGVRARISGQSSDGDRISEQAFAEIVDKYETPLLRYVLHLLGTHEDEAAQDVVQETFLKLHQQMVKHGEASIDNVSSWLFRVAHNGTRDLGRRRSREKKYQQQMQEQVMNQPPPKKSPEDEGLGKLVTKEARERAMQELEHLPEHQKQVILLKILQNMSLRDISKVTGLTVGNAGYRLNQGLMELAQRLRTAGVI